MGDVVLFFFLALIVAKYVGLVIPWSVKLLREVMGGFVRVVVICVSD